MNDLEKKVIDMVGEFFDKKTKNACISDELREKIDQIIDYTTTNIGELLDDADREIDYEIDKESRPVYSQEQEYNDKVSFIMNCQL